MGSPKQPPRVATLHPVSCFYVYLLLCMQQYGVYVVCLRGWQPPCGAPMLLCGCNWADGLLAALRHCWGPEERFHGVVFAHAGSPSVLSAPWEGSEGWWDVVVLLGWWAMLLCVGLGHSDDNPTPLRVTPTSQVCRPWWVMLALCLVRVQELHFFDRLGTGKRAPVPLTAYLQLLPAATEPTKVQVAAVHSTPHAPPLQPSLNTIRQVPTHCFLALWVASCSVHWGCHTVLHSGCN
jgi:hypothetical protein